MRINGSINRGLVIGSLTLAKINIELVKNRLHVCELNEFPLFLVNYSPLLIALDSARLHRSRTQY